MYKELFKTESVVANHKCLGYFEWTDYGQEFDCEYEPDFDCDECVFVVGYEEHDYRKGKRPWRKSKEAI